MQFIFSKTLPSKKNIYCPKRKYIDRVLNKPIRTQAKKEFDQKAQGEPQQILYKK